MITRGRSPHRQSENRVAGKLVTPGRDPKQINCEDVPRAYTLFEAHGSPLGFEYFNQPTASKTLGNYFLAGLHGPTKPKLDMKIGHQIIRFKKRAISGAGY